MNAGEKLKALYEKRAREAEEAARAAEAAKKRLRDEKRAAIQTAFGRIFDAVMDKINNGAIPKKFRAPECMGPTRLVPISNMAHEHYDLWRQFKVRLEFEGLMPILNSEHDGMGMSSWYTIEVEPISEDPLDG